MIRTDYGFCPGVQARASMVYADHLRKAGDNFMGNGFMQSSLSYTERGSVAGKRGDGSVGNYLAVHLRRQDYVSARPGKM